MREFDIKLVALKESIYIANAVGIISTDFTNQFLIQYNVQDEKFNEIVRSACEEWKYNYWMENIDYICYDIMTKHYNRLVTFLKESDTIIFEIKTSDYQIVKHLIDFDEDRLIQLKKMNRYFRFFYLILVHELVIIVDENDKLIQDFNRLLNKLGDFEEYYKFFVSCKQLIDVVNIYLLPDVAKIIHSYGYFDKDIALDKNTLLLRHHLEKNKRKRKDEIQKKNSIFAIFLIVVIVLLVLLVI
jgi:hypothetical protein